MSKTAMQDAGIRAPDRFADWPNELGEPRGGLIYLIDNYIDKSKALEAVGLRE